MDQKIHQRVKGIGSDGKLLVDSTGEILHVTLLEKLLVPLLSKLSNLVVDGGIWMNTQRPEWNDANNALVGNGISMVTLCYLRRYTAFLQDLLAQSKTTTVTMSAEVATWLQQIQKVLVKNEEHSGSAGDQRYGSQTDSRPAWNIIQRLPSRDLYNRPIKHHRVRSQPGGWFARVGSEVSRSRDPCESASRWSVPCL